eukprot:24927_1
MSMHIIGRVLHAIAWLVNKLVGMTGEKQDPKHKKKDRKKKVPDPEKDLINTRSEYVYKTVNTAYVKSNKEIVFCTIYPIHQNISIKRVKHFENCNNSKN